MGNLKTITNATYNLLNGLTYGGNPAFKQVLKTPTQKFTGYPSVTIVNADITSEYDTQQQNLRSYNIMIYVWFDMHRTDEAAQWEVSRDYVDLILDAVDKSQDLSATCDFVIPSTMQPYVQTVDEAGQKLIAPIKITCRKSIDLWA